MFDLSRRRASSLFVPLRAPFILEELLIFDLSRRRASSLFVPLRAHSSLRSPSPDIAIGYRDVPY